MRIVSWNVNGLRAVAARGFREWLDSCGADLVLLQEVRANPEQLTEEVRTPTGWFTTFFPAQRPGYSGVGLFSRREPQKITTTLGQPHFDGEGRVQIIRFGKLVVANVYFPNGSGRERDNSRVPYKLAFYRELHDRLTRLRRGGARVLVAGDFNTAHREIDLARPESNRETSGFLDIERAEIDHWLKCGWIDTFRRFNPHPGHYSWWSQRQGARERNVGWRIDLVLASRAAAPFVKDAFIWPHVQGSDHCPIGVEVGDDICG